MSSRLNFSTVSLLVITVALSGCVTNGGAKSSGTVLDHLSKLDVFDSYGSEFRNLVNNGKYGEAENSFNSNYRRYFEPKYAKDKRNASPEVLKLADHTYEQRWHARTRAAVQAAQAINSIGSPDRWSFIRAAKNELTKLGQEIGNDVLLPYSTKGTDVVAELSGQLNRIERMCVQQRSTAVEASFNQVLVSGTVPPDYCGNALTASDYTNSSSFQSMLRHKAEQMTDLRDQSAYLTLVKAVAHKDTLVAIRSGSVLDALKKRMLADKRIDLKELHELAEYSRGDGKDLPGLHDLVKVGYADLTASSFKDRNVFDFEIAFKDDYGLKLDDSKTSLMDKGSFGDFDYIFVTDLSAAKIYREFKNKRGQSSRMQSGSHQAPNPEYQKAQNDYQKALTEFQQTKISNATTANQPCGSGWGCLLTGALKGLGEMGAQKQLDDASQKLSRTDRLITIPEFSQYQYELVNVEGSKLARVDYFVIDVKGKKVYSSFFEKKDNERFTITYNVHEQDADKHDILSRNQKEEDVTTWEKKPMTVNLADLFSPVNLEASKVRPLTTVEAFLKPLTSRQYASALPTYAASVSAKGAKQNDSPNEMRASSSTRNSSTIADERFDSVLIVKTSKAIGTGFYVTPDLILTAYHVVDGASLVELTFFDGTKTFGKVVDHDVRLDLALIKAQTAGKPVKIHSGQIRLGETAEAIGHPKGYEFTITRGVVSAVRKQAGNALKASAPVEFIQTDTPISPGNSGGPLYLKDTVIGVNDWVRVDKASQNLNFSVSFNEIREYLDRFNSSSR